jgi:serine/threonine protein phosphatase PrpC
MIFVSDGVSSILSDDEMIDLARDAPDPRSAAGRILEFAEELSGGEDNATVIVVPLPGWGKVMGPDRTKAYREYRRAQAGIVLSSSCVYSRQTHSTISWIGATKANVKPGIRACTLLSTQADVNCFNDIILD